MTYGYMERAAHIVVDELGIDPLRDKSWEAIQKITAYKEHIVDQSEENNLPLIANREYRDYRLWWIILAYNGIADSFSVKSGQVLKIPNQNSVTSVLVNTQTELTEIKTVSI